MVLSLVWSCSDNDEITEQQTRAVEKTEAMKQFETSFIGISKEQKNLKQSKLSTATLNSEVAKKASGYLMEQGVMVEQKTNQAAIIKQALDLHLKQLQELQPIKKQP